MTITIEIAPELELQLQRAAAQAGLAPDVYIVETLRAHLVQPDTSQQRHSPPERLARPEANLLVQINQSLEGIAWARYHALSAKRQAETLTSDEQQELIALSDQIETANVQRMIYLTELARLRNTSPAVLMRELGFKPMAGG